MLSQSRLISASEFVKNLGELPSFGVVQVPKLGCSKIESINIEAANNVNRLDKYLQFK